MSYRRPFNLSLLLVITLLMPVQAFALESHNQALVLVLVTARSNQIEKLQPRQFRKLFLDVPVFSNNEQLIPLINTSDKLLYEIFLQKVVYMSVRNYERMLISNTFRTGRPRPEMFHKDLPAIHQHFLLAE